MDVTTEFLRFTTYFVRRAGTPIDTPKVTPSVGLLVRVTRVASGAAEARHPCKSETTALMDTLRAEGKANTP